MRVLRWWCVRIGVPGKRFPLVYHMWAFDEDGVREHFARNTKPGYSILSIEQQHR